MKNCDCNQGRLPYTCRPVLNLYQTLPRTEVAQMRATIEQQAARITELEQAQANTAQQAQIQAQEARTQRAIVMEIGKLVGCANDWEMVGAVRDALKAQPRSAVVLPERMTIEAAGTTDTTAAQYACDWYNSALEEVARLNQPGECVAVPECYSRLLKHASGMTFGVDWNNGTAAGHHRTKLIQAVEDCRALLAQQGKGVES